MWSALWTPCGQALRLQGAIIGDTLAFGYDTWDHAEYEAVKHGGFSGWDGVHVSPHINGEQFPLTSYVCSEGHAVGLNCAVHALQIHVCFVPDEYCRACSNQQRAKDLDLGQ